LDSRLAVRAFDVAAMMIDAVIVPGADLGATLDRFFTDTATDHVQVYNASRGCWAVRVARAG
jgi:hypothetical protein